MIVVFEDKESDILSELFRAAYPQEVAKKFRYSNGNCNLPACVEELAKNSNDKIYVYLDSVPGNRNIIDVYYRLVKLSREYDKRIVIFNIVCLEYYFLKAFGLDSVIMTSGKGLDIALDKSVYYHSDLLETEADIAFSKTFEKYCKLVLMKNYHDCARHSRGSEENGNLNNSYGFFYEKDCKCVNSRDICEDRLLRDKALRFIQEFPCKPSGYYGDTGNCMSEATIISKHRELVDDFNQLIDQFNIDAEVVKRGKTTKHIQYMM